MKLLFGTGNSLKYSLMKERLNDLKEIELVIPSMLNISIDVVEDGNTPEENAIKKAKQYYEVSKLPTIAEDSGLYIDTFPKEEQPGLFVKRINGQEGLSDEVILKYYVDKLKKYGGESLACYHTGVCLIDESGQIHSDTIIEKKFLLTSKVSSKKSILGGVLDCISYDLDIDKYFCERTEEEKRNHYKQLDANYKQLVKKVF